jgi:hypothetical protein
MAKHLVKQSTVQPDSSLKVGQKCVKQVGSASALELSESALKSWGASLDAALTVSVSPPARFAAKLIFTVCCQ